jgi:hypothetical protein
MMTVALEIFTAITYIYTGNNVREFVSIVRI